jgi:hypothetical protein
MLGSSQKQQRHESVGEPAASGSAGLRALFCPGLRIPRAGAKTFVGHALTRSSILLFLEKSGKWANNRANARGRAAQRGWS